MVTSAAYCEAVFRDPRDGVNLTAPICADDPDGALLAQGTDCYAAMQLIAGDCYYDVSGGGRSAELVYM